jgi:hypothetical protein
MMSAIAVAAIPIAGLVLLVAIAAVTGRKIEISRSKITFWPRPRK